MNTLTRVSPLIDRLLGRMEPVTESGCWIWTGQLNSMGYGLIGHMYKRKLTHRAAYELFVGQIPEGLCVCHKCDIRSCINPNHLFLGTLSDNSTDMIRKGRANWQIGSSRWDLLKAGAI